MRHVVQQEEADRLGNGRFVRNLVEKASQNRDLRLFGEAGATGSELSDAQLGTVEDGDVWAAAAALLGWQAPDRSP